ncbi:hypothetical protein [Streptomyces sp. AcE210]|nr:hypothetical protein [Streptomyces sp. AcE210]
MRATIASAVGDNLKDFLIPPLPPHVPAGEQVNNSPLPDGVVPP